MTPLRFLSAASIFFTSFSASGDDELNIANPESHPYVSPEGNREEHVHSDAVVNEARVYDFYQRQADHYMAGEARPKIVPAFPGLDAGVHGHWGKHNQNQHNDGRWNEIDMGPILGHTIRHEKFALSKGIALKLAAGKLSACFDPKSLSYPLVWEGGFTKFDPFRWGSSRNANVDGKVWFTNDSKESAWQKDGQTVPTQYSGYYRHNGRAIFSFDVDENPVLSSPIAKGKQKEKAFGLTLTFPKGFTGGELSLGELPDDLHVAAFLPAREANATIKRSGKFTAIVIPPFENSGSLGIAIGQVSVATVAAATEASETDLSSLTTGGSIQWPQTITTRGTIATDDGLPYVIDTVTIPKDTGFNSVMQITSVGFLPNGTALVATLAGEMWSVSGLNDDLSKIIWKRFAAGLHQPIGIHIDDEGIFVLERGQITRLVDLNHDGEADFYETYANDFDGHSNSHTHSFGLTRDEEGAFYFVNWKDILRTAPDRSTQYYAFGVRNCMGLGSGSGGAILAGPQEGTYTPTSMVIDIHEGEYYGHPGDNPGNKISPPLCFIPRGIDNSTGGFLATTSDRWGPLGKGHTLGFSYGYSTHYLILRDSSTSRHQGATVPLEGDFLSGIMRGAFSPSDGQLYVTGIDGWGDYSVSDGCFQRVRYTGEKLRKPIGFQVHSNGIRVDFSTKLDKKSATSFRNYFVQQWNYEYSPQYGSPEYSISDPESLGHDVVSVCSVQLLESGSSIFVEIPQIEPVMQMHLRMHLKDEDGIAFEADLFPSILELGEAFTNSPDLANPITGKPTSITLRINIPEDAGELVSESGNLIEGERTISLKCSGALQFETKLIEAKAGEPLKLIFENPDIMPHNVVFVTKGNLKKVGDLSFSMLNDPKASEKHYTPEVTEVIAGTHLVQPGGIHTLHFTAPKEPGEHHFVCTFPGHWMTMNGVFRVSAE
tara:strand:- start:18 stop:2837 length:2820 start_codon:yes stop_codon:yes gene_type:complete